jgi:Domain of unknown function (DUF3854)
MPADEEAAGQATEGSSNSTYEGINLGFHDPAQDYTDHGDCTAYRGPDGSPLNENHAKMLAASGIPPEHAVARGYETIVDSRRLAAIGIVKAARGRVPGLLIPLLRRDGSTWGYQYRPDDPRLRDDKPIKYETPWEQRNGLDIPPGMGDLLDDPCVPLWVTEGSKKADCGAQYQLCIAALMGVWNWRGNNDMGGKTAVGDWNDIAVNGRRVILAFDGDVARKPSAAKALCALADFLKHRGASVEYLHLPDDGQQKTGLDDYLVDDHTVDDLLRLVKPNPPPVATERADDGTGEAQQAPQPKAEPVQPVSLDAALATFQKYLHLPDATPVLAVAATVVANRAEGEPVWFQLIGPPSSGKTEILSSCSSLPYVVPAATITEASLLSGTSKHERAADATGGLLREVGNFGILLAKDFTSVLSQNKDTARAAVAALREVYDGQWDRPVGTDGGRRLHWDGKCGFLGGATPSYDRYGSVTNALGDRYLLQRLPDVDAAEQAKAALKAAQHEKQMRTELAGAMLGLIAGASLDKVHAPLDDSDEKTLGALATFTARARTAVERDGYTGELLVIPQPEGPARLVKAMRQFYGALTALGVDADTRWNILARIAVDCAPAIRVPLMQALLGNAEWRRTADIAESAGMVTKTAARHLDDLVLVGIAERTKKKPQTDGKTEEDNKPQEPADNSPCWWRATDWLRAYWPK